MKRRPLDLRSGEEVLAEINRLERDGYRMGGKWSLTQICDHLDTVTVGEMEGLDIYVPWIIKATIGQFFVNRILRTRRFPTGIFRAPSPRQFQPRMPTGPDDPAVIERCRQSTQRAIEFQGPLPPYPLAHRFSLEDWKELMWIHASHHLGFLHPNSAP